MVKEIDSATWDKLVSTSPQGTVFSTTKWMRLFNVPYKLYGVYKGSELIGGWGGFLSPQPATPFQGIIVRETPDMNYTSIMSRHIEVAKALIPYLPTEFYNSYTFTDMRPFKWAGGWEIDTKYSYIVNLQDMSKQWRELDKDTRNTITTESDNHVVIRASMKKFIPLYHHVFDRKGMHIPVTDEFLIKFDMAFDPVIVASDKTIAVAIADNKRAYYIFGASVGEGLTPLVLWNMFIKLAKDYKEVDLCGANDEKIAFYKRGLGGKLVHYQGARRLIGKQISDMEAQTWG